MRVIINGLSVTSGGGLVSLLGLLPALKDARPSHEYTVLLSDGQTEIADRVPDGIRVHHVKLKTRNPLLRIAFEQTVLPFVLRMLRAEWLYSPGNQTILMAACKICLVMENTNPYSPLFVGWSRGERIRLTLLKLLGRVSCWRADKIRFLSENSRRILSARLRLPREKTCVIPHGVSVRRNASRSAVRAEVSTLPGEYVLFASNVAPHKNIECLLRGFDIFVSRARYKGSLLIAGGLLYTEYFEGLQKLIHTMAAGRAVRFLGWVDPDTLGDVFDKADMFVYPSLEESFGLPVIEAMARGVPVLASGSRGRGDQYFIPFDEICGDAALYFDPFSPQELATQMSKLHADQGLRRRLVESGRSRSREFSWSRTAGLLAEYFTN